MEFANTYAGFLPKMRCVTSCQCIHSTLNSQIFAKNFNLEIFPATPSLIQPNAIL